MKSLLLSLTSDYEQADKVPHMLFTSSGFKLKLIQRFVVSLEFVNVSRCVVLLNLHNSKCV